MIQLPSKIRTTLFSTVVPNEPIQLFSHENDRLFIIIYPSVSGGSLIGVGRSGSDAKNSTVPYVQYYFPLYIYGPEPLYIVVPQVNQPQVGDSILIHAVYRA